jgi:hypothetical protein
MNTPEEMGKTLRSFMAVMREQPLSLALVVMNFILLGYLFYSGSVIIEQRKLTVKAIIEWQQAKDALLASCVSDDVMKKILETLQLRKGSLRDDPWQDVPLPPVQVTTDTMR